MRREERDFYQWGKNNITYKIHATLFSSPRILVQGKTQGEV